jgi:hypothetical protein
MLAHASSNDWPRAFKISGSNKAVSISGTGFHADLHFGLHHKQAVPASRYLAGVLFERQPS